MKTNQVFKSEEGKKRVLDYYDSLLSNLSVPFKERYIETSFGKTYLIETGKTGKTAVFLFHGSCSNSAMWFGDLKRLSEQYHVFAVDIIGEAGKSAENRLDLLSNEYANWVNELINTLNIKKAMFMGNSFGGWMTLKFATIYPGKVLKLVLLATSGITSVRLSFILKSIFHTIRGEKGLNALNEIVYGNDDIPEEAIEFSNLIANNFNPRLGSLPNFTDEQLRKLTMPVLYIAGENDNLLNTSKNVKRIEEIIPHALINIKKNTGHVIYDVMNEVLPFLSK